MEDINYSDNYLVNAFIISIICINLRLGCAWLYYGAVLLTTVILETGYDPHCGNCIQAHTNLIEIFPV